MICLMNAVRGFLISLPTSVRKSYMRMEEPSLKLRVFASYKQGDLPPKKHVRAWDELKL